MSDLIARLLHTIVVDGLPLSRPDGLHIEAAAELERLQSELAFYDSKCAKCGDHLGLLAECPHCRDIARLQSQLDQANARERKALKALCQLRDRAYCRSLDVARKTECLGADAKMEAGTFGRAELSAHCESDMWMGKHRAFHEALQLLQYRSQDDSEGRAGELGGSLEMVAGRLHKDSQSYLDDPEAMRRLREFRDYAQKAPTDQNND